MTAEPETVAELVLSGVPESWATLGVARSDLDELSVLTLDKANLGSGYPYYTMRAYRSARECGSSHAAAMQVAERAGLS